jgi:hypothetical protein
LGFTPRRRSPTPFHEAADDDDPFLRWLRQDYLIALSEEARHIPESLDDVVKGHRTLEDWRRDMNFGDGWLISAARFTVKRWKEHGYDGLLHMPIKAVDVSEYGVPGGLRIHPDYQWRPHKGESWAQFRQGIVNEVERGLEAYHRRALKCLGSTTEAAGTSRS